MIVKGGRRMRRGMRGRTPCMALVLAVALALLPLAVAADDPALVPTLRDPGTASGDFTLSSNYAPPFLRDPGTILSTDPNPVGVLRSSQYNRAAAVAYADQWAHGRNPNYPDFTANDCTNFNSQSLFAGGLPMIIGDGFIQNDHNWFINGGFPSLSWSAADHMNQFFSNYQGTLFQFMQDSSLLLPGDVFIAQRPDSDTHVPDHGGFIVGYGLSSSDGVTNPPGTYGLLRDQHSNDRFHVIWDDGFDPGTLFWLWDVVY